MTNSSLFPDRIGRIAFLIRYIVFLVAILFASFLLRLPDHIHSPIAGIVFPLCAVVVLIFCLVCMFRSILFPRLRDVGLHLAFSLIILVPVINFLFLLFLLFVPSNAFAKATPNA